MENKKKVQKKLKGRCPECYGELELIIRIKIRNGITYNELFKECIDCGYSEEMVNKRDRKYFEKGEN